MATTITILATSAMSQPVPIPANTISCDGFKKMANDAWYALPTNPPFDIGNNKNMTMKDVTIDRHFMNLADVNSVDVLESKYGTNL
jgi:hypothetical protein